MRRINEELSCGYRHIILCAPTGVGKSHIAIAFARAMGSSHILTAQKILQDQYSKDFDRLYTLKGRSNFPCAFLCEKADIDPSGMPIDDLPSCRQAACKWKEIDSNGNEIDVTCKYKPSINPRRATVSGIWPELTKEMKKGKDCAYFVQKWRAIGAPHTVSNYPAYFLTRKYPPSGAAGMLERDCIVADEAHEIEDQLIDMAGMEIPHSYFVDISMSISGYNTTDVDDVKKLAHAAAEKYHNKVDEIEVFARGLPNKSQSALIASYRRRRDNLDAVHHELDESPENMIVQPRKDGGVSIKPLDVGELAHRFFDMKYQLYMSATVHKDFFCKTMGISESECAFIEIECSPFSPQNRRVYFDNVRPLNMHSDPSDYAAVYSRVSQILQNHADEKGLILTSRKDQCDDIVRYVRLHLGEKAAARLKLAHNDSGRDRKSVLDEHESDSGPSVLVSPSLWYGVDLKGDLSRFQIIVKTPYLSLSDKRTRAKAYRKDDEWYKYSALTKLLQGMGRSVRDVDDYADTYVLDTGAQALIQKMYKYVPHAYRDVLGVSRADS